MNHYAHELGGVHWESKEDPNSLLVQMTPEFERVTRVGVHRSTMHRWVVRYLTGQLAVANRRTRRCRLYVKLRTRYSSRWRRCVQSIPTGRDHRASRPDAPSALVLCPRSGSVWYQQLVGEASMSPLGHRRFPHRSRPELRWRKLCGCLGRSPLEA